MSDDTSLECVSVRELPILFWKTSAYACLCRLAGNLDALPLEDD
jgi:hypothetical protein